MAGVTGMSFHQNDTLKLLNHQGRGGGGNGKWLIEALEYSLGNVVYIATVLQWAIVTIGFSQAELSCYVG